jgi:peroxiredoxin
VKSRFYYPFRLASFYILFWMLGFWILSLTASAQDTSLTSIPDQPIAPGFELKDADGRQYRLEDMRGKPVIINFWATWCPPCRAEMPSMQRAWDQVKDDGILMLAINVGEDADTIEQFVNELGVDFPLPMDTDSKVAQQWPMTGLPTTFVVDPAGRLVYRAQGEREWDAPELLELVHALK